MATNLPAARVVSTTLDSSSPNITTSFGTGAGSKLLSGLGAPKIYTGIYIYNGTSTAIRVVTCPKDDGTPASDGSRTDELLIPGNSFILFDRMKIFDNVFIRSDSGTISSGKVCIAVFAS